MLQSLEIENVVSFRASDDYKPGNGQWQIGLTSAWINAVGLAPFKGVLVELSYYKHTLQVLLSLIATNFL